MANSIFNQVGRVVSNVINTFKAETISKLDSFQSQLDTLNTTSTGLATEITDRQTADTTLQNNIDTEELARISADTTLQNNINNKLDSNANAISAAQLQIPRNISLSGDVTGTVLFDGSTNVSITTSVSDDSHSHIISNIDGLQSALDSKLSTETTTTLSFLGNILTYVDETGTTTNINLSTYLDDTNLARLIGGVYDADTKEFIFSRDDNSTFRVDASMFFDGSSLVTSVAGRSGNVTLVKADVGLGNVDNTTDLNKPVSAATQTALDGKQDADTDLVSDASYVHTDNNYTSTDKIKLSGIESNATADQSDSEIKVAYENNTNTNAYTDIEKTKLASVESGATSDQTATEIKTLYESNDNTNALTDAEKTKLSYVSITQAVDLDSIEATLANIETESTATTTSTTSSSVYSFSFNTYRSAKLLVQAFDTISGETQISEALVTTDGTTAFITEYGIVHTGSTELFILSVSYSANTVTVSTQTSTSNSTQYKIKSTLIKK